MKPLTINKRGNLTLPKELRKQLGVVNGGTVFVETNTRGETVLRPGAFLPVDIYDAEREAEFYEQNEKPFEKASPQWKKRP